MLNAHQRASEGGTGPIWGIECEDLDSTLLRWELGQGVATHVNEEVDVIMIVLEGTGSINLNGESQDLAAGEIVVIPKGVERSITTTSQSLVYLNVHKRRRRLMPGPMRKLN